MAGPSLRDRALAHLARREHSRAELARKLAGHGTAEDIDDVLAHLAALDLVSDARFADAFVRAKAPRLGTARLRHELARRGVAAETIAGALAAEDLDDELERARRVWAAKFGAPPADAREWARQARFLQGRGFATGLIRKLLKEIPDEPA